MALAMKPRNALEALEAPWLIGALFLWALNDHVFKPMFSNAITGKLSDVACLVVVPVLFAGVAEQLARQWFEEKAVTRLERKVLIVSALFAASVMALINIAPWAAHVYRFGLGLAQWPFRAAFALLNGEGSTAFALVSLTMDATDLWTIPAVLVPTLLVGRQERSSMKRALSSFMWRS